MYAPHTLTELTQLLDGDHFSGVQPDAWRGHACAKWTLDSGAARRFVNNNALFRQYRGDASRLESLISRYEADLVGHARLGGHGYANGRRLSDLELLALLQHHGAATRLVDFTSNVFIALWFACLHRADEKHDGMLIGLDLSAARRVSRQQDVDADLADIHGEQRLSWWRPSGLSPRIAAQASVLVWSPVRTQSLGYTGYAQGAAGHLDTPYQHHVSRPGLGAVAIAVPMQLKTHMLDYWTNLFGYRRETLFPDLEGFCSVQSARAGFASDFFLNP